MTALGVDLIVNAAVILEVEYNKESISQQIRQWEMREEGWLVQPILIGGQGLNLQVERDERSSQRVCSGTWAKRSSHSISSSLSKAREAALRSVRAASPPLMFPMLLAPASNQVTQGRLRHPPEEAHKPQLRYSSS